MYVLLIPKQPKQLFLPGIGNKKKVSASGCISVLFFSNFVVFLIKPVSYGNQ